MGPSSTSCGPGGRTGSTKELAYLGRTTKILRENSTAFLSTHWVPLLTTTADSIWVNTWPAPSKTLYTVYNLRPEGWTGPLFDAPAMPNDHHAVDSLES